MLLLAGRAELLTSGSVNEGQRLCERIAGEFSNAGQMRALPSSVPRKPLRDRDWLDEQHGRFVTFANRRLDSYSIFLEWRSPDRKGVVTRRRIWSFGNAGEQVVMRFYSLKEEVAFERVAEETWLGRPHTMTCETVAQRSGRKIYLGAETNISPNQLL